MRKLFTISTAVATTLGILAMAAPAFASTTYHATDQASLVSDLATATAGDTIVLDNGFDVTSEIAVSPSGITIDGNGQTLTPTFTKTTNSNNSALGIYGDNVTVENLTVDGTNSTDLHGMNVYVATGTVLDNVTLENNDHNGLVVNGSTVTVNNLTTANNGWGGVDVDLGGGVTSPAILTVNGVSHQTEAGGADIYVDDTSKAVSVIDTNSQYTYTDNVQNPGDRLYTLDPTSPADISVWQNGNDLGCGAFVNSRTITVMWGASSDPYFDHYQYQADANQQAPYDFTTNVSTNSRTGDIRNEDGTYSYRVRAVDQFGNTSAWTNWCSVTLDRTAPDVSITNPVDGATVQGTVDVRGTVTDNNPDHYYLVVLDSSNHVVAGPGVVHDTNSFTDQSLFNWDTTLVPDGQYTVELAARDAAGNRDAGSEATAQVTVNNTPDTMNECKKGGWQDFTNPVFKNQGQCVSYLQADDHAGKKN